jgi:trans-2,3-dihydro-3-hydroxyanthranilate isomerase
MSSHGVISQEAAMPAYPFVTLDVFTHQRFGGNPLAVFTDARGLSGADMQKLAREFNLSETTFVLPPEDHAHTARVRIFTPHDEMPFAGHPTVGTGFVLAQMGRDVDGALTLEVPAGLVEVRITRDSAGEADGGVISAPRPLTLGRGLPVETAAACASLSPADIITTGHAPVEASVGVPFFFAEVTGDALTRATPDLAAFRSAVNRQPDLGELALHLYARDGASVRTRMFAPLGGIIEDPATGSANATLSALLVSLSDAESQSFDIVQGVEMGRPSRLAGAARRAPDGIRATIGGGCVMVLRGEAVL